MLHIIADNPFRFLGVYSNSPIRERIANANKLKAYLKVGKEVSFSTDLADLLPSVLRTEETFESANAKLNLPKDQLKYGLFWFVNSSPFDKIALEHLLSGNIEKCLEILGKKETFSSCLNQAIIFAIRDELGLMIQKISTVLQNDEYRISYIHAIAGEEVEFNAYELSEIFVDCLLDELHIAKLQDLFREFCVDTDASNILQMRALDEPKKIILSAISEAKDAGNTSEEQYAAGERLMRVTKVPLKTIKDLLGESDMAYQTIVDKLATQILQCGINFYNKSNSNDEEEFNKAYKLQSYAASIAIGRLVKERCNENVSILDKKKSELAPKGVAFYDKKIKEKLVWAVTAPNKSENTIELVKACAPYLASIKDVLGSSNDYYLKMSTLVVAAGLSKVIAEFNTMMNKSIQVELILDREGTLRRLRNMFDDAWRATLYMEKLDMEPDFKANRFDSQKTALRKQVVELIDTNKSVVLRMQSDDRMFSSCKYISDFEKYLEVFSGGKHAAQAADEIEKRMFEEITTTQDCKSFKEKYPNTKFSIDDKWEELYYKESNSRGNISDYKQYINSYPKGKYILEAKKKIEQLTFESCTTIDDWTKYLKQYPTGEYRQAAQSCIDEENFWNECLSSEGKEKYKEYLSKYPNGRHRKDAEKKASACYVATMVYGDYNHPQVIALRGFRDNVLRSSLLGRLFISYYYKHSPMWVEKMQDKTIINMLIRTILNLFIKIYNHESK